MIPTTLFALLNAADVTEIDGYEVENCNYLPDNTVRLDFCGGDERTRFADQPVNFGVGACRVVSCADPEYDGEGGVTCDLTFKVIRLLMPEDLTP